MDNLNTICSKWGSMVVICLACGAMVYQEHIRSCPNQPSANDIKNSLKHGMRRHFKLPSISNWPLLIILLIIYIAIVLNFQTLFVGVVGLFANTLVYHVLCFCLRKVHRMRSKQRRKSNDFVSRTLIPKHYYCCNYFCSMLLF